MGERATLSKHESKRLGILVKQVPSLLLLVGGFMLRGFSVLVFLWAFVVMFAPWHIVPDAQVANTVLSGLGLVILASSLAMWRKAGSEPH
jgi:hypothetical protein